MFHYWLKEKNSDGEIEFDSVSLFDIGEVIKIRNVEYIVDELAYEQPISCEELTEVW